MEVLRSVEVMKPGQVGGVGVEEPAQVGDVLVEEPEQMGVVEVEELSAEVAGLRWLS